MDSGESSTDGRADLLQEHGPAAASAWQEATRPIEELRIEDARHLFAPFHQPDADGAVHRDLDYHALGGEGFERLCFQLLLADAQRPRFFGQRGQAQYGIDLIVADGRRCTVYQCKNVKAFDRSKLRDVLSLFAREWLTRPQLPKPDRFVLCCPFDLTDRRTNEDWQTLIDTFARDHDLPVDIWQRDHFDARLRHQPDIVADLFSDRVAEAFCEIDDWNQGLLPRPPMIWCSSTASSRRSKTSPSSTASMRRPCAGAPCGATSAPRASMHRRSNAPPRWPNSTSAGPLADLPRPIDAEHPQAVERLTIVMGRPPSLTFVHASAAELVFRALSWCDADASWIEPACRHLVDFLLAAIGRRPGWERDLRRFLRGRLQLADDLALKQAVLTDPGFLGRLAQQREALPLPALSLMAFLSRGTPTPYAGWLAEHIEQMALAPEAGKPIGLLGLALRTLGLVGDGSQEQLEECLGAEPMLRLIEANGTLFELFMILRRSTPAFAAEMLDAIEPTRVERLVQRTIDQGRSIGTLNLAMRTLRHSAPALHRRLETLLTIPDWWRLIVANGEPRNSPGSTA